MPPSLTEGSEQPPNGLPIDEGQLGEPCEGAQCSGAGPVALVCSGCTIDGQCVAAALVNAANLCQICDPARSATDWSSNEGAECDDGLFCTTEDRCAASACSGAARVCEDGVACNGISECDEPTDSCSFGSVSCPEGSLCDAASDACVSTCGGCTIFDVCLVDGAEEAGNPCNVCDVARSTTAFSVAVGKLCGGGATECSGADTCDNSGVCQPNHAAAGANCGDSAFRECDDADSCDGAGRCNTNVAANGAVCDDGQFCRLGDACQGGVCGATLARDCGALQVCDESLNQCSCSGCSIDGQCIAAGATSATNPCLVCDPARNATSLSSRGGGAFCGEGNQCSATGLCRFTGAGLLSAGFWDTCAIRDGQVFCQIAGGPVDLGANTTALQVSTGQHHTCALLANGDVRCWGDSQGSDRGQLGTAAVSSDDGVLFLGTVQLGGRATFVSAGTDYNCAVLDTGSTRCWGVNTIGQLGYGHTDNIGDDASEFPLQDINLGGRRAVQVEAGNSHTCAILEGGGVRCWGSGFGGALGYGAVTNLLSPPPADVDIGAAAQQIATGSSHTCAVVADGSLRCWGLNDLGQLGYAHTQNIGDDETPAQAVTRMVPRDPTVPGSPMVLLGGNVAVGGPVQQVQIRQGLRDGNKTCALLSGAVRCWGSGAFGGLGYAHREDIGDDETPAQAATRQLRQLADGTFLLLGGSLALGGTAIALADGGDQCALLSDDRVLCWRAPEQVPTVTTF
jgi:hypothetical protein